MSFFTGSAHRALFYFMKTFLFILFYFIVSCCSSQVTVYSENCGSTPVFTPVSTYTGWQHPGNYSGNASVRNILPSTGYAGASGGANVFFTNVVGTNLELCCVDTKCYLYAFLSVGIYKSTTASNGSELVIEYSEDGVTWIQMPFTLPTGSGSAIWRNLTLTDYLPLTDSLRLRFRQTSSAGVQFRIDDINVAGIQNIQDSIISNCAGFLHDGNIYTEEGSYDFIYQDNRGCDSILRITYIYDPSDPSCLLPIKLIDFYGEQIGKYITLVWECPTPDRFQIQKLINNRWVVIGESRESFIDEHPYQGYNYYRLVSDNFLSKPIRVDAIFGKPLKCYNILGQEVLPGTQLIFH